MKKMVGEGGDVFISHSHKDFSIVRQIRNHYEEEGFNALCFYLKCLTDDDEITELIKREIDCRSIFVYVDSENSRASRYVKMERDYIESVGRKVDRKIEIDGVTDISEIADRLVSSMSIFISYAHRDIAVVNLVKKELISRDYRVFHDEDIFSAGEPWLTQIEEAIDDAAFNGCILSFYSVDSIDSLSHETEIKYARSIEAFVISVLIGDIKPADCRLSDQGRVLRLSSEPSEKDIHDLADSIEEIVIERFNRTSEGLL